MRVWTECGRSEKPLMYDLGMKLRMATQLRVQSFVHITYNRVLDAVHHVCRLQNEEQTHFNREDRNDNVLQQGRNRRM